jgi:subtilisin family serine protease
MRDRRGGLRGWMKMARAVAGAVGLVMLTALPAKASNNPVFDREWALSAFDVQAIRDNFHAYGAGVIVAVVDSGVDPTQPDLRGQLVPGANMVDPNNPTPDTNDTSPEYHGTHVSAIIAAHGHGHRVNLQGVVGLASRAKIMPLKTGSATVSAVAEIASIRYAADHGARVINISEGGDGACRTAEAAALDYALSKNVVVVAAAGNDGNTSNVPSCPADHPGVIDVAAIAQNGKMDHYSHYGSDVTVAAPGVNIEVPAPYGQYTQKKGTSDAAPWVSAEAALIIGLHPDWTAGQVIRVIIDNTVTGTGKRIDDHVGYGVIDPLKALGAPAPADKSNPLGGPAPGSSGAVGAVGPTSSAPATAARPGKSSNIGLYVGLGVGVFVLIGMIVFLATRGRNNSRSGGGGNGYFPTTPGTGGQDTQPQWPQQHPAPSQQPYPYQQPPYSQQPPPRQFPPQQHLPQPPHGPQPGEQAPWPRQ